ncbi:MAG: C-type lectin domain-containing protein, partial [Deltaproteobacteria bacterium]|nr:C-type lectin domain-containing protein [Deltaproteobacteria bacterium]
VNPDNGNCYWVTYTSPLNGLVARETCVLAGGHLATITSQAESDFVNALAVDAYEASLAATPVVDYYMGATDDDANSIEGVFVWVSGENFAFTNWRELEPNDNGPGDAGEDCAVIEADNGGTWDDRNCELAPPYGYICERE